MTVFETLTKSQQAEILKAKKLVTIKDIDALSYGEDIELTNQVCMSHYCEDDVIVLNLTEEWIEVFQILFNVEEEEIIFESI
mgnify:FL=1|tara:strand:- start:12023 stop:12268 length:246 start_codon:yes stop_codon:yes gene_type:complete